MKHTILSALITLFMLPASMNAQTLVSGSLLPLKSEKTVNFEISFERIHGMSEKDFSEYEHDWYKDKPDIVARFYSNASLVRTTDCPMLVVNSNCRYTVKVIVYDINTQGDYLCEFIVKDNAQKTEIAKVTGIRGSGGHFGSKLNLIKDGAEHTGKKFGAALRKLIKKAK